MNLKQYNQHVVFRKEKRRKKTVAIRENFPPSSAQGQIIQGDCFVSLTIRGIAAGLRNLTASPRPSPLPPLFPVDLVPCSRRSHKLRCCLRWACRSFLQASVVSSWSGWLSIFFFLSLSACLSADLFSLKFF